MNTPVPLSDRGHLDAIPLNANWFYVSDSFTLALNQGSGVQYYQPGVANQSVSIPSGQQILVFIKSCSLVTLPLSVGNPAGVNTDLFVGLYDISQPRPVWENRMPFAPPYGRADNGLIMNQVSNYAGATPRAFREFGARHPLVLGQRTPDNGGSFQVGAGFQFNYGSPVTVQYEYHVHGAWAFVE